MNQISLPIGTLPKDMDPSRVIVLATISDIFYNAHHHLLTKYHDQIRIDNVQKEQLWLKEYNVNIVGNWFALEFNSELDYMAFILKWS